MILQCTCHSDYQDKKYGKNQRVMNPTAKVPGYNCTVCGRHQSGPTQTLSKSQQKRLKVQKEVK